MNNDLIKRSDVEQMLTALGGCDASDKEAEGWDKAIDAAMDGLRKVESASGKMIKCLMQCQQDAKEEWNKHDDTEAFGDMIGFSQAIGYIEELTEPYKED